jgi:septum formation protein
VTIRFVLASASPGRRALLHRAGVTPEVIVSGVDEDALTATLGPTSTSELVGSLASAKASDVAADVDGPAIVVGCDSMLDLDGVALGKPGSVAAAIDRWQLLRGRSGTLMTGHCVIDVGTGATINAVASTTVYFAQLTDADIELYCNTGEPSQVAGAFTVDGLGGWFIDAIDGDHHNVVGLSLPLLRRMLAELGYGLPEIGYGLTSTEAAAGTTR